MDVRGGCSGDGGGGPTTQKVSSSVRCCGEVPGSEASSRHSLMRALSCSAWRASCAPRPLPRSIARLRPLLPGVPPDSGHAPAPQPAS